MRWPTYQNTADCIPLVNRDYIPEPVASGPFPWLWSPQTAFCSLKVWTLAIAALT